MKMHSEDNPDWERQRMKIIGLGESSIRKSYYPELQRQHAELLKRNEELRAAYEDLASKEGELRENYLELSRKEQALRVSEHRNAVILETIPDVMITMSRHGIFLNFRTRDTELLALPPDQIVGKNIRDSGIGKKFVEIMLLSIEKAINTGELQKYEYDLRLPHGLRSFEARIVAIDNNEVLCIIRDITSRKMAEEALSKATRKLNFLNAITFNDIQNAVFGLSGYLELEKQLVNDDKIKAYKETESQIVQGIIGNLQFSKHYQNLGLKPPQWQDVMTTFLFGISHADMTCLTWEPDVEGLEIFADPLLETVFFSLAENVVLHGENATTIRLYFDETPDGLKLFFEDNGTGIGEDKKELIFERSFEKKKGMGLVLTREILGITGITISETGLYGKGARFEILVPVDYYRFSS
jgi:PAS domain S-box-containing protein